MVGRPGSGVLRTGRDRAAATYRPVGEWIEDPHLARLTNRLARDHGLPCEDLEDLLQDVRLALCKAGTGRRVNSTWIYKTALHKVVDRIRSESRQTHLPVGFSSPVGDEELLHLLHTRISRMPAKLNRFCSLRYEEGLNRHEIAERMRIGRGSVRWLETRALEFFRKPSANRPGVGAVSPKRDA